MSYLIGPSPSGLGIAPDFHSVEARATVDMSEGELCIFDLAASVGSVDNVYPGNDASVFKNVKNLASGNPQGLAVPPVYGVCQSDVLAGRYVEVCHFGVTKALVQAASGNVVVGSNMQANQTGFLQSNPLSTGSLIIAVGAGFAAGPSSATLGRVFLFGTRFGTFAVNAFT